MLRSTMSVVLARRPVPAPFESVANGPVVALGRVADLPVAAPVRDPLLRAVVGFRLAERPGDMAALARCAFALVSPRPALRAALSPGALRAVLGLLDGVRAIHRTLPAAVLPTPREPAEKTRAVARTLPDVSATRSS